MAILSIRGWIANVMPRGKSAWQMGDKRPRANVDGRPDGRLPAFGV
jgi:hypothetical protein